MTSSMKLLWLGAIWESVDRAESANGHLLKAQKKKTLGLGFGAQKVTAYSWPPKIRHKLNKSDVISIEYWANRNN